MRSTFLEILKQTFRIALSLFVVLVIGNPVFAQDAPTKIDFSRDIQPILSENCYYCHGQDGDERKADLRLDVEEDAQAVFVAGDAQNSDLYLRIISDDPDELMPPHDSNRSLSKEQIELIKRWINEGGRWAQHWAYAPIKREKVDSAKHESAIDFFVERKLKQNGLDFSPEAEPETLIRRVSLDLTGLPPTPEQVDQYINDQSVDAYEKMVDRFLDSPAYGERMAWTWLDAARYADSNGYQGDKERTMWPWRDWVVKAYNQNMPFDQFSTWQLAGDLLPNATQEQKLATGFNRNHPINGEGGRIAEENRIDYVMDMAETTGTVWIGLTFNCCRCHDHKYDQLTQEDYYSLFAFFNQTPITGGGGNAQTPPVISVPSEDQLKQIGPIKKQIAAVDQQMSARAREIEPELSNWEAAQIEALNARTNWNVLEPATFYATGSKLQKLDDQSILSEGSNPDKDVYSITAKPKLKTISGVRVEALNHKSMTKQGLARSNSSNFVLTDFAVFLIEPGSEPNEQELKFVSAVADYEQRNFPAAHSIDDDPQTGWAILSKGNERKEREAVFTLAKAIDIPADAELKIVLKHESAHKNHNIGRFRISLTDQVRPQLQGTSNILAKNLKIPPKSRSKQQTSAIVDAFNQQDKEYAALAKKKLEQDQQLAKIYRDVAKVMVMEDMSKPRKSFRLNRGSYQEPLNEVSARVPSMFADSIDDQPETDAKKSSPPKNRLALAQWLFEKSNPLTPRVTVNRIWVQFFGTGIVKTTEDFGVQGEPPSHPALLDWLATEYRDGGESGWDTKHIIRSIVNSRTYKQSSKTNPQLQELDPKNRLLARASRFRMPAWMLRDNALAASGRLVTTVGGKPVNSYQPAGVWEEASFGKKKFKLDSGDSLYRRSIYTFWRRIAAPTMFFDNADRMTCSVKTFHTNTPLHALGTLNDVTFVEAARLLATDVLNSQLQSDEDKLKVVYRRVLARQPDKSETSILISALNRTRTQYRKNKKSAELFVASGESAVDGQLDVSELASWTSLCLAVFNLDETLTRQ